MELIGKKLSSFPCLYLAIFLTSLSILFFEPNVYTILFFILVCIRMLAVRQREFLVTLAIVTVLFSMRSFFIFQEEKHREQFIEKTEELSDLKLRILPDTIKVNGDSLSFVAKTSQQSFQCYYKLKTENEQKFYQTFTKASTLLVDAKFEKATAQRNLDTFDYDDYLRKKHLVGILKISQIKKFEDNSFFSIRSLRRSLIVHTNQTSPAPLNEYINGLLFGELSKNFDETKELYRSLGILHLFALSGVHVSFFIGKFRKLFIRLGLSVERIAILQTVVSLFYWGLTGFSLSVLRAVLQNNTAVLCEKFKIEWQTQQIYGFVVLMALFIEPYLFLTTSGQLSFFLGFILIFAKKITQNIQSTISQSIVFGLVLSVGILPLLLLNFYEWNPMSVIFTILIGFLFEKLLLPLLIVVFSFSYLYPLSIANHFFVLFENVLSTVEQKIHMNWTIGKPQPLILILLCASVLVFLSSLEEVKKKKMLTSLALLASCVLCCLFRPTGMFAMVDVGQGDSLFYQTPFAQKTILIDVGGKREIESPEKWKQRSAGSNAEKTLIPFLKARGVRVIDELFLTHAHEDHFGDVLDLAKAVTIRKVFIPKDSAKQENFQKVLKKLYNQGVEIEELIAPTSIGEDRMLLSPLKATDGGNNDSLVIYQKILGKTFLFTGDMEKESEELLMATYPTFTVDVLKAGHHGSKTSSSEALLDYLQPKSTLISCGVNNQFKHPHQETMDRYNERKMEIYRTDEQGMIYTKWFFWEKKLPPFQTTQKK